MIIKSLEEFIEYINEDIKHKEARIIRFINVESLSMWIKVKSFLNEKCSRTIRLSDYCDEYDLTPNINRMFNDLKMIDVHTLVIPLSEHLRINNTEADRFLERIIKTEFINDVDEIKVRVFIPIYRMKDKLVNLIKKDQRYKNCVIFFETGQDTDYSLTIVPSNIDTNIKGNNLYGYKQYLIYWEENPEKPIILHTSNAKYYADIVFSDNVKVLVTAFDLLKHHYHLNELIKESWGEEWQWKKLLAKMKNDFSLTGVFEHLFNAPKHNIKTLLSRWESFTDFERWALWLWSKLEVKSGYLSIVLDNNCNWQNFIENIINTIFKLDIEDAKFKEYYNERKEYINSLSIGSFSNSFWNELKDIDVEERIFYLTDCTSKGRCEVLNIISTIGLNSKIKDAIKYVYPYLGAYISDYIFEDERLIEYFAQYKIQKIENSVNEEFVQTVKKYATSKGIWWGLESRNKIVDEIYSSDSIIYWIDALGVEYLNLIEYILKNNYASVFYNIEIGYANIPTITEYNNDFIKHRNVATPFRELDKVKHELKYPEYIPYEFVLIEKALKNAIALLSEYDRVIITSDHGASRLAVIGQGNTVKAKETSKVERHGRYCIDRYVQYSHEFLGCIDYGEYHVFADYDRFSISGRVKGEIHGGASLEEVLVPIIELSKKPFDILDIPILLTPEVRLKAGQKVIIRFKLKKEYDNLYAIVGNKRYKCIRDRNSWYFKPDVDKREVYKAKIVANRTLGVVEYRIIKGITSNLDI
ncbi:MAG: BREX-4 system phosphatase PglZ [Clostridiaceae bacterium]|nr:BREX-4 system phosphatase PglZ [Clostridiaceae bacterium]